MLYNLTYILADDEEIYREYTQEQLSKIAGLTCISVCENALATREQLQLHQPDLLILDIEMPGLTGIQLAKSIKQLPLTIFITSHPNYAADAFELDAVDYLVKPVQPERLLRAIDKVRMLTNIRATATAAESFQPKDEESFFIKDKNTFIRIAYAEVLYAESLGDFVNIYLQNGEKKIALVSLKNLEQQLPRNLFIRISRTHLINKLKISAVNSDMVYLGLLQLPVGKTYADTFMQTIVGNQTIKRFI